MAKVGVWTITDPERWAEFTGAVYEVKEWRNFELEKAKRRAERLAAEIKIKNPELHHIPDIPAKTRYDKWVQAFSASYAMTKCKKKRSDEENHFWDYDQEDYDDKD